MIKGIVRFVMSVRLAFVCTSPLMLSAEVKGLDGPWLASGDTLLCFGDSLTAQGGYVKNLAAELEPMGIRVVNGGLGGDKTPMALTRLAKVVEETRPDAIFIFFGANDSVIGRGCWRDEPLVAPETYRDNLVWIVHYCRLRTKVRKFSIAPPAGVIEGEAGDAYGDVRRDYALKAREAADVANAVFVPLDSVLDRMRKTSPTDEKGHVFTTDGIHLNEKGNRVAADTMLKTWRMKSRDAKEMIGK